MKTGTNWRRLAANRANAKRSTGPRTPAGKARARVNAHKHGLAAHVAGDPEVERLVGLLGGDLQDPRERALVRRIAESQCIINRAQHARRQVLQAEFDRLSGQSQSRRDDPADAAVDELIALAVLGVSSDLVIIDRYQRRALSARGKALQELALPGSVMRRPTKGRSAD